MTSATSVSKLSAEPLSRTVAVSSAGPPEIELCRHSGTVAHHTNRSHLLALCQMLQALCESLKARSIECEVDPILYSGPSMTLRFA